MAKANLKTQASRKGELGKKDKRANKGEKRAEAKSAPRSVRASNGSKSSAAKPMSAAASAFIRGMKIGG